jgi:hypothetical protein
MRKSISTSVFGILIVPAALLVQTPDVTIDVESTSRIWVKGTSSVRAFECQVPVFESRMVSASDDAVAAILAGEKAIDSIALAIPSMSLDCRNGSMNGHMRKAINAADGDTIGFTVSSYSLTSAEQGMNVTLEGSLALGGVTKPVTVAALAKAGPEGTVQVTGSHELNMRDYGLKPPTLMFGTMKVHDKVTVGFDLLLKN